MHYKSVRNLQGHEWDTSHEWFFAEGVARGHEWLFTEASAIGGVPRSTGMREADQTLLNGISALDSWIVEYVPRLAFETYSDHASSWAVCAPSGRTTQQRCKKTPSALRCSGFVAKCGY